MDSFTPEQMKAARRTNLYDYLLANHSSAVIRQGNSLILKNNHSISIKKGFSGYLDFSTGETGNGVDLLVRHFGYDVPNAVISLCGYYVEPVVSVSNSDLIKPKEIIYPEPADNNDRLFDYLHKRHIPFPVIQFLINSKLIYQEKEHNNIVFINKERDFMELRGTCSKPFHSCRKSLPDRFWWFRTSKEAKIAYICESSIDAISLYVLNHIRNNNAMPAYYISIAGVSNIRTIQRIKEQSFLEKIILAVDNDKAGQECRDKNNDLEYIVPVHKDWNEDLMSIYPRSE